MGDVARRASLELVDAAGNQINFDNDDTGQLSRLDRAAAGAQVNMTYDGRGFLALATEPSTEGTAPDVLPSEAEGSPGTPIFADGFESGDVCAWSAYVGLVIPEPDCPPPPPPGFVTPTYSSDGLLYALTRSEVPADVLYFYFDGRPVAQLEIDGPTETFKWISTDHLGTPVLLTSSASATLWSGGFEPFGADYGGAGAQGLFLRFPGQWEEGTWSEASSGAGVYQNVHRWYLLADGRYSNRDPVYLASYSLYSYSLSDPINVQDPLGLLPEGTDAETTCLVCTVYAEARGQSGACQRAVASVIRNRASRCRKWGGDGSICTIVSSARQFDGYKNDNYRFCEGCSAPADELAETWRNLQGAFPSGPEAEWFANNTPTHVRYFKGRLGLSPVEYSACPTFAFFAQVRDPFVRPGRPSYCR